MDAEFWLARWQNNELGFQLDEPHPLLRQCLPAVMAGRQRVLVPLCGKSPDMRFLAGHFAVVGAELSAIACHDFFTDSGIAYTQIAQQAFSCYTAGNIVLWQGDFFALTREQVGDCDLVYDRAALIALPSTMRQRYAAKLRELMRSDSKILLLSLEYPQHEKQGPPFSVSHDEITELFSGCNIELLTTLDLAGKGFARRRFATTSLVETAYCITLP